MKPIIQYDKKFGHLSIVGEFVTGTTGNGNVTALGQITLLNADVEKLKEMINQIN